MVLLNQAGVESGLPDLTEGLTLPVLQDTSEADVFDLYGASKWYLYIIDAQGIPRFLHYTVDMDGERDRILAEIAELAEEAR